MGNIEIYPSTWYYNACVQGFLEVIDYGLGTEYLNKLFQEDGTLKINKDELEGILSSTNKRLPKDFTTRHIPPDDVGLSYFAWWWAKMGAIKYNIRSIQKGDPDDESAYPIQITRSLGGSNSTLHSNFSQDILKQRKASKENNMAIYLGLNSIKKDPHLFCSFCNNRVYTESENGGYIIFDFHFSKYLGSSGGFPNRYWQNSSQIVVCPICKIFLLCFYPIYYKQGRGFINTGNIKLNWRINRQIPVMPKGKNKKTSEFTQWFISNYSMFHKELQRTIGAWMKQGIEVITFSTVTFNYQHLEPWIIEFINSSTGLDYIAKNHKDVFRDVMSSVIEKNLPKILGINYQVLRNNIEPNNQIPSSKKYIAGNYQETVFALSSIYYSLVGYVKKKEGKPFMKHTQLANPVIQLNLNQKYKLLQLVNADKRADAYYLLLRAYIVQEKQFPRELSELFDIEDSDDFKNAMFTYIAQIKTKDYSEKPTDEDNEKKGEGI